MFALLVVLPSLTLVVGSSCFFSVGVSQTFASEQETFIMRRFDYSLVAFIGQYSYTTVS